MALYCILHEKGILSKKIIDTFGKNGTPLMAHASHKVKGVEFSTGSLGHGLPVGVGKALYFKTNNKKKNTTTTTTVSFFISYNNTPPPPEKRKEFIPPSLLLAKT